MNTSRSQSLVYTVNWCRSSQHRLPPNKMCQNIVKKVPSRKYHNKQFTARLNLCRDFSQTTYQPPDDPFRYEILKKWYGICFYYFFIYYNVYKHVNNFYDCSEVASLDLEVLELRLMSWIN